MFVPVCRTYTLCCSLVNSVDSSNFKYPYIKHSILLLLKSVFQEVCNINSSGRMGGARRVVAGLGGSWRTWAARGGTGRVMGGRDWTCQLEPRAQQLSVRGKPLSPF